MNLPRTTADVGLLSLTSALALTSRGHYIAVPQNGYQPVLQGAVALKGGANGKGAAAFLRYLYSPCREPAAPTGRPSAGAVILKRMVAP